jgi:hypothetical protein
MRKTLLLFSVLVAACSGAGSGGIGSDGGGSSHGNGATFSVDGDASSPGESNGGGFGLDESDAGCGGASLAVASVSSPKTVGDFPPDSGDFYAVVELTLRNTGASSPLPTDPGDFTLETADGLLVESSLSEPTGACDSSISVATYGDDTCAIAFEVPIGQTVTKLTYADGCITASATVP